jgi:hypothetical protein
VDLLAGLHSLVKLDKAKIAALQPPDKGGSAGL